MPTKTPTRTRTRRRRTPSPRSTSSRRAGAPEPSELDLFARFCSDGLRLENGKSLKLHDFQRRMLADLFEGVRETVILLPKKNGKSTILAALALYHLCTTPDAECVIAAAARDQAAIMLRQAQGFIRRSPALGDRLQVKQREIIHRRLEGRVRILASDVDTADGIIPTLGLVDELHRHKSPELYGIFRDGLGPRSGRMVTISTAGDDETSPLGQLRTMAYGLPGMQRDGPYRRVRSEWFALHEWALDPDDDRDDIALVKRANPAPWHTVEELAKRHDSPSTTAWQWGRFACGVWMAGEEAAISHKEWGACADPRCEIPEDAKGVYVGIDLGWKWDTTAIVPVWRADPKEPVIVGHPRIIVPPRDGTATEEADIWDPIEEISERWSQVTFVLDPEAGGEQLAQRIDSELNARVATHSQKPSPMALAAQRLSEAIASGRIRHPDHAELNHHVLSAAAKPGPGEGWRFVKQRRKRLPIDGVIALAMGHSALLGADDSPPKEVVFL